MQSILEGFKKIKDDLHERREILHPLIGCWISMEEFIQRSSSLDGSIGSIFQIEAGRCMVSNASGIKKRATYSDAQQALLLRLKVPCRGE